MEFSSGTPGDNDIDTDPLFVDSQRNIANFHTHTSGLNNASGTAWADAASITAGDIRSLATSGVWNGDAINYRALVTHTTDDASDSLGAPGDDSDTPDWRDTWEFASYQEIWDDLDLFEDPENLMGKEMFASKTPLTRSLPYEEHIPVTSVVTTYESARQIVREAGYGAIGMCYCRHKKEHLNQSCDKNAPTQEICISLGNAARFMVRRGFAQERSVEELLLVLDRARELNLTHITDNIRHKPSFICNCCSCCCELLGGVMRGFPLGVAKASYTLEVAAETCLGCGLCSKACNVEALIMAESEDSSSKKIARVSEEKCLGCGACISVCKTGSLSLTPRVRPEPPARKRELFARILKEKKRLTPFVIEGVKKKVMSVVGFGK